MESYKDIPYCVGLFWKYHKSTQIRIIYIITLCLIKIGIISGILFIPLNIALSFNIKWLSIVWAVLTIGLSLCINIYYYKHGSSKLATIIMLIIDLLLYIICLVFVIEIDIIDNNDSWFIILVCSLLFIFIGWIINMVMMFSVTEAELFNESLDKSIYEIILNHLMVAWYGIYYILMSFLYEYNVFVDFDSATTAKRFRDNENIFYT